MLTSPSYVSQWEHALKLLHVELAEYQPLLGMLV
jgi:hypothetical protein